MDFPKSKKNIKPFDGEKYSIWKMRVRALLTEMKVLQVVDDEAPVSPVSDVWLDKNLTAKGIIIEYLSDSHLHFAKPENTAKEIFQSLDAIYERKSIATQIAVKKKLFSLKLQGDVTLMKHFTIFDDLITELQAAGGKVEESDKVAHLLVTLPASYNGIITAIETLSEDNLTVAFVKTRLLDHEIKLKSDNDTSAKILQIGPTEKFSSMNTTQNNYRGAKRKFFKGKFNGKFKKQNVKRTDKFSPASSLRCHHCGRNNHLIKDCIFYKRRVQNKLNRERNVQTVQICHDSNTDATGFAFMAKNEEVPTENKEKLSFILDSGASAHIIKTDKLFKNCVNINPPLQISVAKCGSYITAYKRGTIHVTSHSGFDGILEDVLYCPEVPHNLLSVRKIQQAGFNVIFNQEGVEIKKGSTVILVVTTKPQEELTDEAKEERIAQLASLSHLRGPYFDNAASKNVTAIVDQTAFLNCRVHNLGNKTVSWIRHRDIHLLTVGRYTYTSDQRFSAIYSPNTEDWALKILYSQRNDSGIYECQVSTTPPIGTSMHLSVVEPVTTIIGGTELYINQGSTMNLTCVIKHSPEPPPVIYWTHDSKEINYDSPRGGVSVITEKGEVTTSYLLIQRAASPDSGKYTCNPSNANPKTILVHVLNGEHPAAMQHGGQLRLEYPFNVLILSFAVILAGT